MLSPEYISRTYRHEANPMGLCKYNRISNFIFFHLLARLDHICSGAQYLVFLPAEEDDVSRVVGIMCTA